MNSMPRFARFRNARNGATSSTGKLPQRWDVEHVDDVVIEDIDLGPLGPSATVTLMFDEDNDAEFCSLVLAPYMNVPNEDAVALRMEAEVTTAIGVKGAFVIVREWIAGGTFVGQATRPVTIDGSPTIAVVVRTVSNDERVLQPLLSFHRNPGVAGRVTVTIRRLAFASLYDHPGWLADGRV